MEKKRRGGQPGNQNAKGHGAPIGNRNACGHGAPLGNKNALKHGLYETILLPSPFNLAIARYMEAAGIPLTQKDFLRVKGEIMEQIGMKKYWSGHT